MGMAAILFNGAKPFDQIVNTISTKGPMWIWLKLLMSLQRRNSKKYTILFLYIAQGQGQIIPGEQILIVTKKIFCFNHTL